MLSLKVEHLCYHKYEMDHKFPHGDFEPLLFSKSMAHGKKIAERGAFASLVPHTDNKCVQQS